MIPAHYPKNRERFSVELATRKADRSTPSHLIWSFHVFFALLR